MNEDEFIEGRDRIFEGEKGGGIHWFYEDLRRFEWLYVMDRIQAGRHPSAKHLGRLIRQHGIPDLPAVREYVASRIDAGPQQKPFAEPENFELYGTLTRRQAAAIMDLFWLYRGLRADGEELNEPGPRYSKTWQRTCWHIFVRVDDQGVLDLRQHPWSPEAKPEPVEIEFVKIQSRQTWRVREPKIQAREIIARRYGVSPDTLKDWERQFKECYERYRMEFF